jgi:hypothetical protein
VTVLREYALEECDSIDLPRNWHFCHDCQASGKIAHTGGWYICNGCDGHGSLREAVQVWARFWLILDAATQRRDAETVMRIARSKRPACVVCNTEVDVQATPVGRLHDLRTDNLAFVCPEHSRVPAVL